ncbi:MAG TPA: tetratricopeptide repeat protein [Candidatus Saccharimonadia bacterium]|nr:tetratricopeptide repeat protein [Candidatus Saccharimonadia bacterium]
MPQVRPEKSVHQWKIVLIAVASIIVLVGLAVGVLYWQWLGQAQQRYDAAIKQADTYMRLQHYDNAAAVYQRYLNTHPDQLRTYKAEILLAEAYEQKGDYKAALSWYQKAERTDSTYDLIVKPGIGRTARALGNKALSIQEYKATITLVQKTDSPLKSQTIRQYQTAITAQGGSLD